MAPVLVHLFETFEDDVPLLLLTELGYVCEAVYGHLVNLFFAVLEGQNQLPIQLKPLNIIVHGLEENECVVVLY